MRRSLVLLLALPLLALGTAACGTSGVGLGTAAKVGSWELSESDFTQQLTDISDQLTKQSPEQAQALFGPNEGSFTNNFASQILTINVQSQLLADELEARGIEVTDADRQKAESDLQQQLGVASSADLGAFGPVYVEQQAQLAALDKALEATATSDDALRALYDQSPETYADGVCLSFIYLQAGSGSSSTGAAPSDADKAAALADANAVLTQLRGGAAFADVAKASSDDPQSAANGGDVGCLTRDAITNQALVDGIAGLPEGALSQPVDIGSGFLVIRVDHLGQLSFEQARTQLEQAAQSSSQQLSQQALTRVALEASVTINPKYGTWNPDTASVDPPQGASAPSTTSPTTPEVTAPVEGVTGNEQ